MWNMKNTHPYSVAFWKNKRHPEPRNPLRRYKPKSPPWCLWWRDVLDLWRRAKRWVAHRPAKNQEMRKSRHSNGIEIPSWCVCLRNLPQIMQQSQSKSLNETNSPPSPHVIVHFSCLPSSAESAPPSPQHFANYRVRSNTNSLCNPSKVNFSGKTKSVTVSYLLCNSKSLQ